MALYFFYAFLVAGAANFICSILVLRGMTAAGIKVSFFEIRWQVHKHLKTYKQVTMDKNGSVAWPYYGYHCSLAGMVGFMILTLFFLKQ